MTEDVSTTGLNATIARYRKAGLSYGDIAEKVGLTRASVAGRVWRMGLRSGPRKRGRQKGLATIGNSHVIARLTLQGFDPEHIATRLDIHVSAVVEELRILRSGTEDPAHSGIPDLAVETPGRVVDARNTLRDVSPLRQETSPVVAVESGRGLESDVASRRRRHWSRLSPRRDSRRWRKSRPT